MPCFCVMAGRRKCILTCASSQDIKRDILEEMEKPFVVDVDCSKIFQNSEAAHYAMLIDSSKMSIVYELVEWLRWMFSLKSCIYLKHGNLVIHELEDIQLLSVLKNFEIMPCGEPDCAHKKTYRTLLENLNLIVSWKNTKVHKYFLDKINQMTERLTQENTKAPDNLPNATIQNLILFNSETENEKIMNLKEYSSDLIENQDLETNIRKEPVKKKICITDSCCRSATGEETSSAMASCFDKGQTEKEDNLNQFDKTLGSVNHGSEAKNTCNENTNKSISVKSPVKKKIIADQRNNKHHTKPKPVKPFTLGDILSVIRKDIDENNLEGNSQGCASVSDERNPEGQMPVVEKSFSAQDESIPVKARQRTRKRKRPKRQTSEDQGFISLESENKNSFLPLKIASLNFNVKRHHIRFDLDEDVNNFNDDKTTKESECISDYHRKELENDSQRQSNGSSMEFFKNECDKLLSFLSNTNQEASEENNAQNCSFESSNEITGEEIVLYNDKTKQCSSSLENIQLSNSSHDLNDLLSLREKYKKGIVIQRF